MTTGRQPNKVRTVAFELARQYALSWRRCERKYGAFTPTSALKPAQWAQANWQSFRREAAALLRKLQRR